MCYSKCSELTFGQGRVRTGPSTCCSCGPGLFEGLCCMIPWNDLTGKGGMAKLLERGRNVLIMECFLFFVVVVIIVVVAFRVLFGLPTLLSGFSSFGASFSFLISSILYTVVFLLPFVHTISYSNLSSILSSFIHFFPCTFHLAMLLLKLAPPILLLANRTFRFCIAAFANGNAALGQQLCAAARS